LPQGCTLLQVFIDNIQQFPLTYHHSKPPPGGVFY
jgi:hypothetical protein